MSDCSADVTTSSVAFGKFRKCISVSDEADLYNLIYEKLKYCPNFPKAMRIQFKALHNEWVWLFSIVDLQQTFNLVQHLGWGAWWILVCVFKISYTVGSQLFLKLLNCSGIFCYWNVLEIYLFYEVILRTNTF